MGTQINADNQRRSAFHQRRSAIGVAKKSTIARSNKKPKFSTREVRRCFLCGRKGGYIRKFGLCRIHFRELASEGLLPGVKKSSW